MPNVKAVHALQAGRRTFEPGEIVQIADPDEADSLVARGAAVWPDDRAAAESVPELAEESDLPADFPGRAAFIAAGFLSIEEIESVEDLTSIDGIGGKTAAAVAEYLADDDGE